MKRSSMPPRSALIARSPLSSSGALSGGGPARGGPLRPISAQQRRINAQRRPVLEALLSERPWCEAQIPEVCTGRSTDGHELLRRSQGGDPTRPDRALCRPCHDWVTTHPAEAVELGLARWSWMTAGDGAA